MELHVAASCLNCGNPVTEKFCGNCGQSAHTHRYSFKHFIEHDFIHGVWHVDKGFFYTIAQLFTNPGHSVRGFVMGRRANYFNFVTLILLVTGISTLLSHYTHFKVSDIMSETSKQSITEFERVVNEHPKLTLLVMIPISSFFSFIWFRKAKFNYSEHLVLNSYKSSAELLVLLLFSIITIFYHNINGLAAIYYIGIQGFLFFYAVWFYYQFFSKSGYSKKSLLIRSILVPVSFFMIPVVIGIVCAILTIKSH
ncbi:DUF3667 domain-containing protein [Mucilaginibacter sp. PAMB04168]|uniref:DUF3667 domain-containing protein n=1 Tax=Mucilaginibacter sp. PAMB04168 TaxID=3138567 RepID=UPI0031F6FB56